MLNFISKIFKAWESFFLGMARCLDLSGSLRNYPKKPKQKSLQETWNEDITKVQKDFNKALKKVKRDV